LVETLKEVVEPLREGRVLAGVTGPPLAVKVPEGVHEQTLFDRQVKK
jgi:hypothetical protein